MLRDFYISSPLLFSTQRLARALACISFSVVLMAGCVSLNTRNDSATELQRPAPEAATGYQPRSAVTAQHAMIVTAHPLASQAGLDILHRGGTAVDAAIAAELVLNVVEPQSSGIGGGGFMLHFDGKQAMAYEGRETAPQTATPELFLDAQGKPLPFYQGVVGGRSVGVPGLLRMLALAHQRDGKLPWEELFAPAIALAENGFAISPRLASLLQQNKYLRNDPNALALFYDAKGLAKPAGAWLRNPELATNLKSIARQGVDFFYRGPLAQAIVQAVQQHPTNPGELSLSDMSQYQAQVRPALCTEYRRWQVCGAPPPSSGGITVAQILGILQAQHTFDIRHYPPTPTAEGVMPSIMGAHILTEAERLAYADRNRFVADDAFVKLPNGSAQSLLSHTYLAERAKHIGALSQGVAPAGRPIGVSDSAVDDMSPEFNSTTHISVVDKQGHAVALTASIEDAFGARLMVGGFLLNNQLTDFSFNPTRLGLAVANRVQGGKRPRSSMSPTFVFNQSDQSIQLILGSPGGSFIINYVAQSIVAYLDWHLPVDAIVQLPHVGSRNGPTELELGRTSSTLQLGLQARGHNLKLMPLTSGLNIIGRLPDNAGWIGATDPRREGSVRGE